MKKALITGIAGQDGSYLADLLLAKGYAVFGLVQSGSNMRYVPQGATVTHGDLGDPECLRALVEHAEPDEVYNLAGITDLKTAYEQPDLTMRINYESVAVLLGESARVNPQVRFLQASSSEVFVPSPTPLNEDSPRDWGTANPYAKSKMMVDRDVIVHAREHNARFAFSAILFNHESPRRAEVSALKKITRTLRAITRGEEECLHIGNIALRRDWGFAPDYVSALWSMLQITTPEDLVLATGNTHSVQEAIDLTAELLGMRLSWQGEGVETRAYDGGGRKVVVVDPSLYRPMEAYPKVGDRRKAERIIGWKAHTSFSTLIRSMLDAAPYSGSQQG